MYPSETLIDNRYLVKEILGKGGMGTVYSTIESSLNRKVAVKVLHSNLELDNEMHARFDREAQCLSRITHKNIVTVYRLGEWRNSLYVAMEQVEGETLETRLKETGKMPVKNALELVAEIAAAMEFAHQAGIVHRDLKPANIILTKEGTPKILDFGLCRDLRTDQEVQKLTATGILLGSINYMSPEACAGLPATNLSDIYSLGIILYQCVSGAAPFSADTPIGTLYLHKHQNVPLLKASDCERSAELNELLSKCLAKKASQRYQSMEELRTAILSMLSGQSAKKRAPVVWIATSSTLILATIVISIILPKLPLQKASRPDTSAGAVEQKHSINFQTLSPLASKPIVDKAWELVRNGQMSRALALVDPYLASPKLKPRTRIFLQAQKAKMLLGEPEKSKPLWANSFKLSQKELQKSNDTDSNHLYFATGKNYAEVLAASGEFAEAEQILNKLLHTERYLGNGGSRLSNTLPAPNKQELLLARADLALQTHDLKTANKIADELVSIGHGDLTTGGSTGALLLSLNRDKDVADLIAAITPEAYLVSPFHQYTAKTAAAQLLQISQKSADAKKWKLAKAALDGIEVINDEEKDMIIAGVGLRWRVPIEQIGLLYKQGRGAEADPKLVALSQKWINENKETVGSYDSQNPIPLILILLEHGFQTQADQIILMAEQNLYRYAPRLEFGKYTSIEQNRDYLLRQLNSYIGDPVVAKFRKLIQAP